MKSTSIAQISESDFERMALSLIAAKRSEHTRRSYRTDLYTWLAFCRELGCNPMTATLDVAVAFRDRPNISRSATRRALAALSGIYRVLRNTGNVAANPFHTGVLEWPANSTVNVTQLLPEGVAEAMIAHASKDPDKRIGARDVAILRLLYDTGLRRSSIANLKRDGYSGETIRAVVKGDKETENRLPAETIAALDRWLKLAPASPWMFSGPDARRPIVPTTVNNMVRERGEAVGAKNVHPHQFRATYITGSYDAGIPEYEIQGAVHHGSPMMTRRYDRRERGKNVALQIAEFRKAKAK